MRVVSRRDRDDRVDRRCHQRLDAEGFFELEPRCEVGLMEGQRWNPEEYARNARFVSDLGEPVLDLLAPVEGERVLDLGCGDGVLTRKICEAGCAVVAVDSSTEQVAAARAQGLDARVEDAESLPFDGEFEAVFSNAVLHWVKDHDAMLEGV